jgi:hypothetical protein
MLAAGGVNARAACTMTVTAYCSLAPVFADHTNSDQHEFKPSELDLLHDLPPVSLTIMQARLRQVWL